MLLGEISISFKGRQMKPEHAAQKQDRLPAFAIFAGVLAAAGLPIYIHAPKFYYDEYGISLTTMASVLFLLRLLDVFQDPFLGWLASILHQSRGILVIIAGAIMSFGMIGLFAVPPQFLPAIWFAIMLALVFSSFSLLTIVFYAQGVDKAGNSPENTHIRIAAWRETGALIGVCFAAIAPTVLALRTSVPFAFFSVLFAAATLVALLAMRKEWVSSPKRVSFGYGMILRDPVARRLLLVAFLNASPVAITSTLFLFFVESRLQAPGYDGPFLLLFFLAAAISTPFWGAIAARYSAQAVLLAAMLLAIAAFSFAIFLQAGDIWQFAIICIISGTALGADMTLLPSIFAARIAKFSYDADQAFAIWSFVTKLTLAIAAITVLPLLQVSGLEFGLPAPESALRMLTVLYAVLPCLLKLLAFLLLYKTKLGPDEPLNA